MFWEAWNIIQKDFYGKIPTNKELTYGAIHAVLKTLNDQHTVFIEPQGTAQENEQLRGDFQGIGANVNLINGQVVIVSPIPGSPAEKAGVLAGDIIVKVDDKDVTGLSLDEVVALIRGPKGTAVKITLQRKNQPDPVVLSIVRSTIPLPSVIAKMQENNIGYVRLTIFGEKSKDEVVNAINDLKKQGAKGLIFDLRGNPGWLPAGGHRCGQPVYPRWYRCIRARQGRRRAAIPGEREWCMDEPAHGGADR